MSDHRPPPLDELVSVLWAPSACLSAPDGQVRSGELDGFYRGDVRLLSCLTVEFDGAEVKPVGQQMVSASEAMFAASLRPCGDDAPDASLLWCRRRTVGPDAVTERLEFSSFAAGVKQVTVIVRAEADLAPLHLVRGGAQPARLTPRLGGDIVAWTDAGHTVTLTADLLPQQISADGPAAVLTFTLEITPHRPTVVTLRMHATETATDAVDRIFLPQVDDQPMLLAGPQPVDPLRRRLLQTSLADLERMILADPLDPRDRFLAAGSPWFFTLFGRDAVWSASLLLPTGGTLAAGTLRALQRRQGTRQTPGTEEEPGKILHEVRRETLRLGEVVIPPVYFGSIDATALWIRLLHATWRAGMPDAEVAALLPGLDAALDWITRYGDADGDGFIEYSASVHGGLANQGWKDSPSGVRWADGRNARAPLALCEVQGYAYAAAVEGAQLLDAFDRPGAPGRRAWAAQLRDRFRDNFWVTDDTGTYPAIALDRDKKPVDGAASNMGHLLGTGLLDPHESVLVAARLAHPDMDSGYGLRTLSSGSKAFNPLSYHCGSIWPHDTAIAVLGLAAEGHHELARSLAEGMVTAAEHFDFRLPELYAGTSAHDGQPVLAYPTACRPQAWAAAAAVAVVGYLENV